MAKNTKSSETSLTTKLSNYLFQNEDNTKALVALAAVGIYAFLPSLISKLSAQKSMYKLPSMVYNAMIVSMTAKWYETVLKELEDGECVLDVGIGTAGALLQCADIIKSKNLRIVGLDYNALYIEEARIAIQQADLEHHISVVCMSIYDTRELDLLISLLPPGSSASAKKEDKKHFDSAYFSGSFSLLPSPVDALHSVAGLLPPEGGKVYITQTYQRYTPPFLSLVKPLVKFLTTVDFGRLVTTTEILDIYKISGLKLLKHEVMEDSIDSFLQAAYLSILSTEKEEPASS